MAKLYIDPGKERGHIQPELQGHFSEHLGRCIYEGIYVGEDSEIPNEKGMRRDVVEALREIRIPVLRWPGGCFADDYHWKDGIGPKGKRRKIVNTHWGGVVEDNSFGTHEFMELCRQLGCKAYVNGNMGSGTVQEMSEWVEYMTFDGDSPMAALRRENGREEPWRVDYFGIGNESWGCGGNMRPEYYGDMYRRYQTFVRSFQPEHPLRKIACGANAEDYHWTEKVLETLFDHGYGYASGLSLHYYTVPSGKWGRRGQALEFTEEQYYQTLREAMKMEELMENHSAIMDRYDPEKKMGMIVDEWGTWYQVEPGTNPGFLFQQNTMRDALVAGIHLNLFQKRCDRVKMANLAQVVNVLQAVILTEGERMVKTPTWHVFHMYRYHQGGELLDSSLETGETGLEDCRIPELTESVSRDSEGKIHITLTNASLSENISVEAVLADTQIAAVRGTVLTGEMQAHNSFEEPERVKEADFPVVQVRGEEGKLSFVIPACSVVHLEVNVDGMKIS